MERVAHPDKRLLVLLADPLHVFYDKGEIKPRYYNPGHLFSEVHFISPARCEIDLEKVRMVVGDARMIVHPLGPRYAVTGRLPVGPVAAVIKGASPDLIRAYDPGLRGCLAALWGRRLGVPSVVSVHGDPAYQRLQETPMRSRLRERLARYALRGADAVICVSRQVEEFARRCGARRVEMIYNRVDCAQFAGVAWPRGGKEESARRLTVLSVGRLVRPKDPECLIRAIHSVPVTLRLIGDGGLRQHLERVADELGVGDRVEFIRRVPHAGIAGYYQDADIFAIATRSEGFCIPVLEAMASGLPVVASRIDPIEEVLGGAGCLVDHEPMAFAQALTRLVGDPVLRQTLGARARARALVLDGRLMEEREAALYRSLLP